MATSLEVEESTKLHARIQPCGCDVSRITSVTDADIDAESDATDDNAPAVMARTNLTPLKLRSLRLPRTLKVGLNNAMVTTEVAAIDVDVYLITSTTTTTDTPTTAVVSSPEFPPTMATNTAKGLAATKFRVVSANTDNYNTTAM